jgi:Arc/MetJ family transcription regulator
MGYRTTPPGYIYFTHWRDIQEAVMTKILVDVNDTALAEAMELLGTKTKKDTVNLALEEVAARLKRARASERFRELADSGRYDFEEVRREWE